MLITGLITLVVGIILIIAKSYAAKRGEILATKKDIGEITKLAEQVKSDLQILTQTKLTLSSERYNSLLSFHNAFSARLNYLMAASFDLGEDFESRNEETIAEIKALALDYEAARSRLLIFHGDNDKLIESINDLGISIAEISMEVSVGLAEVNGIVYVAKLIAEAPNPDFDLLRQKYSEANEIVQRVAENKLEKYKAISGDVHSLAGVIFSVITNELK